MAKRNYIGLACSLHDPALAIVDSNGAIVFAEAAERALQTKRAYNNPPAEMSRAAELIEQYGEPDSDLVLAQTWTRQYTRALVGALGVINSYERLKQFFGRKRGDDEVLEPGQTRYLSQFESFAHYLCVSQAGATSLPIPNLAMAVQARRVLRQFKRPTQRGGTAPASSPSAQLDTGRRIYRADFDHHLTHAAAACFSSPFSEAVCAVVDGYGERFSSTRFYRYQDGQLTLIPAGRERGCVSLGLFYFWLCIACGFEAAKGEEWKVMGLAPYGQFDDKIYQNLKARLAVEGLRIVRGRNSQPLADALASLMHAGRGSAIPQPDAALRELIDCDPADLALAGQRVFEEAITQLLVNLHALGLSENLVLTGGCALNSSCNGKLLQSTPFKKLYAYCAPGDDGNAVGAALLAYYRDHPHERPKPGVASPYLGSPIGRRALDHLQRLGKVSHVVCADDIVQRTARLLAEGKIVGWMQGRAEFGPRALGNRSILADPRPAGMKERLNERVKFREEFRPFAPAILHEFGDEYFEHYQESPYMERTLRFRKEVIERVSAVVHVDGTGRLQTVKHDWNERFHALLVEFHRLTGVPVLLNTSFNVMGKPIIHSVEDAVAVFFTSGLDVLVIEDMLIVK